MLDARRMLIVSHNIEEAVLMADRVHRSSPATRAGYAARC